MKSFSRFNLIKSKLSEGKKSFLDLILEPKYHYVEIELPLFDFRRGEVLISDIERVSEDAPSFDLGQLINLLYLQFMHQVRKGSDISALGHKIMSKMEQFNIVNSHTVKKKHEKLTAVSPNLFMLQTHETIEKRSAPKQATACLTIRMRITEIYRGEVLLYDIYQLNQDYEWNVEQLITMLYLDFIDTIKREGNSEDLFIRIIDAFEFYYQYM